MDEPYRPSVRTQAALEVVWRHLMGPGGFDRRSIWLLRVDADHRPIPVVTEITDCEDRPGPELVRQLGDLLRGLDDDDPGGSFAFLLSRPGAGIGEDDRVWARCLLEAGTAGGVRLEMLHLATDAGTVPLPPDELVPRRTA